MQIRIVSTLLCVVTSVFLLVFKSARMTRICLNIYCIWVDDIHYSMSLLHTSLHDFNPLVSSKDVKWS